MGIRMDHPNRPRTHPQKTIERKTTSGADYTQRPLPHHFRFDKNFPETICTTTKAKDCQKGRPHSQLGRERERAQQAKQAMMDQY